MTLSLEVYASPARQLAGDATFSPVTSTLLLGDMEAVLVDAQFIEEDIAKLGDLIERSGRRLKAIVITHGHADHYFGGERLGRRFQAPVVALPGVVAHIAANHAREVATFRGMIAEGLVVPETLPVALDGDTLDLDGEVVRVIEVGQGDIAHSSVVHVPALDLVVAGDVAYDGIHQMLGLGGPAEWEGWIRSVDAIAALSPATVIAGHRKPDAPDDDADRILNDTRSYIDDFAASYDAAACVAEILEPMMGKYPRHGNPATLFFSAAAAIKRKRRQPS